MIGLWDSLERIVAALASGETSAIELCEAGLQRIEQVRGLNAFLDVHAERAREAARKADRTRRAGGSTPVLLGIPTAVKDNIDEAGVPCRAGCRAYDDRVPERDAPVVARLREAGAVILGRTNMDELADGVTSENEHFGPVHNPWRAGFHPGGSSGGSAAAVAAGCVPFALGTDTGGSVRIPASLCGVVGFKPTFARISNEGCVPLAVLLDHVGVIARSVRDAGTVVDTLVGEGPMLRTACDAGVSGVRFGVLEGFGASADPAVAACFEGSLRRFERLGGRLRPVRVERLSRGTALMAAIYGPEAAALHAERLRERPEDFGAAVRADLLRGAAADPARRVRAIEERDRLRADLEAAFCDVDLLVCPTTVRPAQTFGSSSAHDYLRLTVPFNLSGQPAVSVPMGLVGGLPVGLQLAAAAGQEAVLCGAAAAYERDLGFQCRPPGYDAPMNHRT